MITIYKLTAPNGKSYIGQTNDIHERFLSYSHLRCKGQPKLYQSLKKYGWENFNREILEYVSNEVSDEYEQHYISKFKCCETGLNLDSGGTKNKRHSPETIQKIKDKRALQTMMPHTDAAKLKIGIASKSQDRTKERYEKVSNTLMGHSISKETRDKISSTLKGSIPWNKGKTNLYSDETRLKMSDSKKGKKCTEETKLKMSNSHKGCVPWNKGIKWHKKSLDIALDCPYI